MRVNEHVKLVGTRTVLVPYEARHVEKYHEWMKDEKIRELTASEPLSLEEEYAMQASWRADDDKLTFIVLARDEYEASGDEIASMIGDVNIFVHEDGSEVEVMIAEESARGRGIGREVITLMMGYAARRAHVRLPFTAKIGFDNEISIGLFKSIGFSVTSSSEVFREHTLQLDDEAAGRIITAYDGAVREEKY